MDDQDVVDDENYVHDLNDKNYVDVNDEDDVDEEVSVIFSGYFVWCLCDGQTSSQGTH